MKNKFKLFGLVSGVFISQANAMVPVIDTSAITQLTTQVSSLATQIQMMQQNLTNLGQYNWNDINSAAGQVAQAMNSANALAYSAQNVDSQFKSQFPGYTPSQNFGQMYQQNTSSTLSTISGSLKAMNMSYSQFQDDNQRLKAMQSSASGADGALKALQANAQITSEVAQQVSGLRSVMMAQTTAQNAYMGNQINNQAQAKADLSSTIKGGNTTPTKYGTYNVNADY